MLGYGSMHTNNVRILVIYKLYPATRCCDSVCLNGKKRTCMFLICLIFQYLWIHNIIGSSSFRVDKEIVWIADSGTGNIWLPKLTKKERKVIKAKKKKKSRSWKTKVMFTFIICVRLFSGKKRLIKNIFLNYSNIFGKQFKKENFLMVVFRWRMLKKEKKIFCKQFVRIKMYLLLNQRNMVQSLVSLFKLTKKERKVIKTEKNHV